jgi:hypothetical protein
MINLLTAFKGQERKEPHLMPSSQRLQNPLATFVLVFGKNCKNFRTKGRDNCMTI